MRNARKILSPLAGLAALAAMATSPAQSAEKVTLAIGQKGLCFPPLGGFCAGFGAGAAPLFGFPPQAIRVAPHLLSQAKVGLLGYHRIQYVGAQRLLDARRVAEPHNLLACL